MFIRKRTLSAGVMLSLLTVALLSIAAASKPDSPSFEVWAADQSDTHPDGGGLMYIWDGAELSRNASKASPDVVDMAQAALDAGCGVGTRPHMVLANHTEPPSHVIVSHTASPSLFFMSVDDKTVVGCVPVDAHAAVASPDNSMIIAADIGDQLLTKVSTDYANDDYQVVESLFLGTPDVLDVLGASVAGPVCHEFTADGRFAYVTLNSGGLVVVDVGSADGATPMEVVKVYPSATVPGLGCGAVRLPDGSMMTNGESGAGGGDDFLYIFDTSGAADGVFPDPVQIELPGEDTHGSGTCLDKKGNLFAWTAMRVSNDLNVIDLQTQQVVKTQSMARPWSPDPKPDVLDIVGDKMFVALRGPKPLSAINSLENAERTPGVAVITINKNCRTFHWSPKDLASMDDASRTTTLADGTVVTAADPHGLVTVQR